MTGTDFARAKQVYHAKFWRADNRLGRFVDSAALVRAALDLSCEDLEMLMNQRAGPGFTASGKSIGRWLAGGRVRAYGPLSNLCAVLRETCADRRCDLSGGEISDAAATIEELANRIDSDATLALAAPVRLSADGQLYPHQLQKILEAIEIPPEEDHPDRPEFPPHSPRFPATPAKAIDHGSFKLIIKDESYNPTGTHKDRWAWEKLLQYRGELETRLRDHGARKTALSLPRLSMISAGSAAYALQTLLRLYGLPPLRVLMDQHRTEPKLVRKLEAIGASVTLGDLDEAPLSDEEVRKRTDNRDGSELTTRSIFTAQREKFYDWLACEILLEEPTYIFLPFGTGELFINIILFLEEQAVAHTIDKRLADVNRERLGGIHVIGATAAAPNTLMDKLYAKYRPTTSELDAKLEELKARKILGSLSGIVKIEDRVARKGQRLAERHKINTELSGIAGLGLFLDMEEQKQLTLTKDDIVMVVNTGWLRVP